jgi:hypothetical protein
MMHDTPTPSLTSHIRHMVDELDRLRHHVEAALAYAHGSHTFDDVAASVLQGRTRMWTTAGSIVIVEKVAYPQQSCYHVFLAGGDMDEIIGLHEEIIACARADGCSAITLTGRRGWARALLPHGWTEAHTTMRLEI